MNVEGPAGTPSEHALGVARRFLSPFCAASPCAAVLRARVQDSALRSAKWAGVKTVILSADDFGASARVNAAVQRAHCEGALTSAGLMVAEPEAAAAVEMARSLPTLDIGLHVALSNGRPASAPSDVPALVGRDGRFVDDPARCGLRAFFVPAVRAQVRREVRAQFDAYERTGLPCTHVDGHQHLHVHPVIWDAILGECVRLGVHWIRVPHESFRPWSRDRIAARRMEWLFFRALRPRCLRTAQRAGLRVADRVYGHLESGRMAPEYVRALLSRLEGEVNEIYFHPGAAADDADLRALLDPGVRADLERLGLRRTGFSGITVE